MNRTGFQDNWVPLYPKCLFYAFKDVILRSSSSGVDNVIWPHSDQLSMDTQSGLAPGCKARVFSCLPGVSS